MPSGGSTSHPRIFTKLATVSRYGFKDGEILLISAVIIFLLEAMNTGRPFGEITAMYQNGYTSNRCPMYCLLITTYSMPSLCEASILSPRFEASSRLMLNILGQRIGHDGIGTVTEPVGEIRTHVI